MLIHIFFARIESLIGAIDESDIPLFLHRLEKHNRTITKNFEDSDGRQTDGAASHHQCGTRFIFRAVNSVQGRGKGFRQGSIAGIDALRDGNQHLRIHFDILGKAAG